MKMVRVLQLACRISDTIVTPWRMLYLNLLGSSIQVPNVQTILLLANYPNLVQILIEFYKDFKLQYYLANTFHCATLITLIVKSHSQQQFIFLSLVGVFHSHGFLAAGLKNHDSNEHYQVKDN